MKSESEHEKRVKEIESICGDKGIIGCTAPHRGTKEQAIRTLLDKWSGAEIIKPIKTLDGWRLYWRMIK